MHECGCQRSKIRLKESDSRQVMSPGPWAGEDIERNFSGPETLFYKGFINSQSISNTVQVSISNEKHERVCVVSYQIH